MSPAIASVELAIETHGLTKQFGRQAAVAGIDLAVPTGSVFGFLGPNGSGKTTTIRMLLGLASATSGEISLLGRSMPGSLRAVLPRVGALVEGPAFYPFLSGTANLRRLDTADPGAPSASRGARVQQALERVGLTHAAGKKVHAYSLGMKQRLGIANALLMPRELLVLDEPTNGLDPQGTREVRSLVRSLAAEGTTVFVSSHLLAEVEQMCSHVAVMRAGTLVAQGTLDELRGAGEAHARLDTPDTAAARQVLERLGLTPVTVVSAAGAPGHLSAALTGAAPEPEVIVAALVTAGVRVRGFTVAAATLEERFVALTGEGFDVAQ
ncbi:ATP-binding cassette domain-containing protein [Cryobacterium sp. RTS3]|uniref:ABC transporter ATP-binding protein n=1 Tax=Cryobacterium sp. RTS3 TaxID=3048643 RepID=UPI002B23C5B5|nr:ATP-binding cassette domain-containing protein [Cryobacterium sp. RTS3]MEA9999990.1 ATP-binding cassette domain-containing protein [Cryobacterium sp. RTS3]